MSTAVKVRDETVDVRTSGRGKFAVEITVGPNAFLADEPEALGGNDLGPRPHELLLAALGACTAMTLRMYADRKGISLRHVAVHLGHRKIKAADCPDCTSKEGEVEEIVREVRLEGDLDEATRQKLLEIANKCPVHKALTGEIKIRTRLAT